MSLPTVQQARDALDDLAGIPFGELLSADVLDGLRRNKGGSGQAIERLLGVPVDAARCDLADGELKTVRCDRDGYPLESVAVLQVGRWIDDLLGLPRFDATPLADKLRHVLLAGICKDADDPATWRVALVLDLDAGPGTELRRRYEQSYQRLAVLLLRRFVDGGMFSTLNAPCLQMRVRDHRPYSPLYSDRFARIVSDKNIGFYLRRDFVAACVDEAIACGARALT